MAYFLYSGESMNELLRMIAEQTFYCGHLEGDGVYTGQVDLQKFAELIVRECDQLNQKQSFELTGVVVDVEQGNGFDSVCLDTVERVESYLADSTLKKHFGVEE